MPPHHAVLVIRLEPRVQGGHPVAPSGNSVSRLTHQRQRGSPRVVTVGSGPCYQSLTPQGRTLSVMPAGEAFTRNCLGVVKIPTARYRHAPPPPRFLTCKNSDAHTNVKLSLSQTTRLFRRGRRNPLPAADVFRLTFSVSNKPLHLVTFVSLHPSLLAEYHLPL